jgi:putative addiction module killer protein
MHEIRHYVDDHGHDRFAAWRERIRDAKARVAVDRRILRMELGNFGDHKALREGVWELRVDVGPGYRIYYAYAALTIVLLLCGGDKRGQDADIDQACACWSNWKNKNNAEHAL